MKPCPFLPAGDLSLFPPPPPPTPFSVFFFSLARGELRLEADHFFPAVFAGCTLYSASFLLRGEGRRFLVCYPPPFPPPWGPSPSHFNNSLVRREDEAFRYFPPFLQEKIENEGKPNPPFPGRSTCGSSLLCGVEFDLFFDYRTGGPGSLLTCFPPFPPFAQAVAFLFFFPSFPAAISRLFLSFFPPLVSLIFPLFVLGGGSAEEHLSLDV